MLRISEIADARSQIYRKLLLLSRKLVQNEKNDVWEVRCPNHYQNLSQTPSRGYCSVVALSFVSFRDHDDGAGEISNQLLSNDNFFLFSVSQIEQSKSNYDEINSPITTTLLMDFVKCKFQMKSGSKAVVEFRICRIEQLSLSRLPPNSQLV